MKNNNCECSCFGMSSHVRKLFLALAGILLVYVIIWMATLIRNNIREFQAIGRSDKMERTILVTADAKVTATPDIAVTTIGALSQGKTVAEAQEKNNTIMNNLVKKLTELGIAKEDLKTLNYNVYPHYNYTESKGQQLDGYEINQSLQVKVRDLTKANAVFAAAGEVGANNVGGLEFVIDDRDVYIAKAREEAMKKIGAKARALSESLGVRMGEVITYNEYEAGNNGYPVYMKYAEGMGGDAVMNQNIQTGNMDIALTVNVTFEVR